MRRRTPYLASFTIAVAAFTHLPALGKVPANYASLVPSDAYAVAWVDDVEALLNNVQPLLPPDALVPTNLAELLAEAMSIPAGATVSNHAVAWVERGIDLGNGQFGAPQVFFAVQAKGANAANVDGGPETSVFFSGDMIIVGQGSAEWTKPNGRQSPLFRTLSNDSISLAIDIEAIWTDRGSQLQMLGGFGAMAAQMALMEQAQGIAQEDQARVRKAQQKVGEVIRRTISSIYDELKVMDTITVGIDLDNDGSFTLTTDFIYQDALAKRGVSSGLLQKAPGGQPVYFAADAALMNCACDLDLDLAGLLLAGLSKEQGAGIEAFTPMVKDLLDSVTGGCVVAVDPNPLSYTEFAHFEVQDANEFINGFDMLLSHISDFGVGVHPTKHDRGAWTIEIDGAEIGEAIGNDDIGALTAMGPIELSTKMRGTGTNVALKVTAGAGEHGVNNDTALRDTLRPKRGRSLVMGMAVDLRVMLAGFMDAVMAIQGQEFDGPFDADGNPTPLTVTGSTKGKSFQFTVKFNAQDLATMGMMTQQAF